MFNFLIQIYLLNYLRTNEEFKLALDVLCVNNNKVVILKYKFLSD